MECYMTIFDYYTFDIKGNIPIFNLDIDIDEETNAISMVQTTHYIETHKKDIVVIKQDGKEIYWGIIKEVIKEKEEELYTYLLKYITNLFDEKVLLEHNINGNVTEGYYRFKAVIDSNRTLKVKNDSIVENEKIVLWDKNSIKSQIWNLDKIDNHYNIKNENSNKYINIENNGAITNEKNIIQSQMPLSWDLLEQNTGQYNIAYHLNNNYVINIADSVTANGTNIQILENSEESKLNLFYIEQTLEPIIWNEGIEDFICKIITDNFISNEDNFVNLPYLEIEVKTHSQKNISVSNVENGIFNLHTFINNCTQNYNIMVTFQIVNKKLKIIIENKTIERTLINTEMVTEEEEVFETDITSKVVVITNSGIYKLYLLNDRTTTTNALDPNRAEGKTETIYTENIEDANQSALNIIKQNTYNHNITFKSNLNLKIGQPISIRTKNSIIYDTYISAIKMNNELFKQYTCGNIRVNFIDKILKERNK